MAASAGATSEGKMPNRGKIRWQSEAAKHDYEAARGYLRLLFSDKDAHRIVEKLRKAPTIQFEAKDILRASQTHLLDADDAKVHETLKDIKKGRAISPVLLIRGQGGKGVNLIIADGHHRICASWHWDDKAPVSCSLVELPAKVRD
jgi:hypothetical protein